MMTPLSDEQKAKAERWYEDDVRDKNCRFRTGGYRKIRPVGVSDMGLLRAVVFVCDECGHLTQISADKIGV